MNPVIFTEAKPMVLWEAVSLAIRQATGQVAEPFEVVVWFDHAPFTGYVNVRTRSAP